MNIKFIKTLMRSVKMDLERMIIVGLMKVFVLYVNQEAS